MSRNLILTYFALFIVIVPASFSQSNAGIAQTAKLTSSNGRANDFMGWSTATDGVTVVAGAPHGIPTNTPGQVYVFEEPANGWTAEQQTAELKASDGTPENQFGWSVGISGDTIVVGAPEAATPVVYVFVKPAGGWTNMTETARLTVTGTVNTQLGYSVAIRANTIVIDGFNSNSTIGAAYVFEKPAGGWTDMTQTATLTSGVASDSFGFSLAMDEHTILVGAPEGNRQIGAAYIFVKPATGWQDTSKADAMLIAPGKVNDVVGYTVGFDDKVAVVSDLGANNAKGAALIYVEPAGGWAGQMTPSAELSEDAAHPGTNFAEEVAIRGELIAVSNSLENVGANQNQGAVLVYVRPAAGWASTGTPNATLTASDGETLDQFGWSLSVAPYTVAVGAFHAAVGSHPTQGADYVFTAK
jgi:hypothetical protein